MLRSSILSLIAVVVALGLASTASAALHNGLQVLYEFDVNGSPETNTASSGNAGTNTDVVTDIGGGIIGSGAGDFAVAVSKIEVSTSDLPNIEFPGGGTGAGSISVSYWMKTDKDASGMTIFATNEEASYPTAFGDFASVWKSFNNNYVPTNNNQLQVNMRSTPAAQVSVSADYNTNDDGGFTLHDDAWHHVAITMMRVGDFTTTTLYADGAPLVGAANPATAEQVNGYPLGQWIIGTDSEGNGPVDLDGLLDDFGIWNRKLSSQDISDIYDAGLLGNGIASFIPEPSSLLLMVFGLFSLGMRRRSNRC